MKDQDAGDARGERLPCCAVYFENFGVPRATQIFMASKQDLLVPTFHDSNDASPECSGRSYVPDREVVAIAAAIWSWVSATIHMHGRSKQPSCGAHFKRRMRMRLFQRILR